MIEGDNSCLLLQTLANNRHTSVKGNKLDWGDSPDHTAISNDFLSDLLPHYVTPRHRQMNKAIDNDFNDVIIGRSKSIVLIETSLKF